MKFDAVKNKGKRKCEKYKIATEVTKSKIDSMKVLNQDGESMQIKILTDKIIEFNKLKKVDNPIMFERGYVPTIGGLFSEYIFGTTAEERMRTHAYIDLKRKFIHPYVYEILKKVYRNIDRICAGESAWFIQDNGKLIEIKDENDERYNEDNTGLDWFIKNYYNIKFEKNESQGRKDKLKFLRSLTDDEIFITKWIVIPVFYRDVDMSSSKPSVPELNYEYNKLIKYTNTITKDSIGFFNNKALYNIQMTLINIRKYGQTLIEKKKGAFHQSVLGKSIDYGVRAVISVPVMNDAESPDELPVDILHAGVPLAQCIILGYPFIMKYCLDFFRRNFENVTEMTIYRKDEKGELKQDKVKLADQMAIYTKDYIHKRMKSFINTYGSRFEPIKIQLKNGEEVNMSFTGRGYSRMKNHPEASTISGRPMTWTDLFYLAAEDTLSDKHVYVTRYPLIDFQGMFPCRCRPLSTIKTSPMMINGRIYPFYPVIDPNMPSDEVSIQFIDTVSISNLYLSAIGGDYDGDQITIKMVYSLEANQEAEEILNDIKHYMSIQGSIIRDVGNEAYLTFYNMTKY